MADNADVQVPDITPEDFDGEKETPKADSSPVEAKAEEKKPEVENKVDAPEAPIKTDTEGETEKLADETVEDKPGKAEERKVQLNTEIRDLVAQRNALKQEVTKANAEVYQPATEDELVEQGLSATDARVEALRQQIEVKDYNDRVADAQLTISSEAERVLRDFPMFDPNDTDVYDKELASEAAMLLEANLILDPNTQQIIGSNVSPYQLYKTLARASGISTTKGQLKGQQDTEQMLANADSGSSSAPAKAKADPLAALWAEPL